MTIDWKNLEPLPLKRQRNVNEREHLAQASFFKKCASHKGRCHFHAYQRRQQAARRAKELKAMVASQTEARRSYLASVRAYWRGDADHHPAL